MRLIAANPFRTRFFIIFSTVLLLTTLLITPVQAGDGMVIAPSTIVINANLNANDGTYRNNRENDDDNTVKAIIPYVLDYGCELEADVSYAYFSIRGFDSEPIESLSTRYCYVDDNLIVEFDRKKITGYIESYLDTMSASGGSVDVDVDGYYFIDCGDADSTEIAMVRTAELFLSVKNARK
jgi:hypothetical protein